MLELVGIAKSFDRKPVLRGVSLSVASGEIACLLGASGCGKSTLLRIVAGLEQADAGRVLLNGAALDAVPVHERGFGLMFQEFALFPHRNVGDNVAFGLRMAGLSKSAVSARVDETLRLVGLAGYERREINNLSGGEKQRVALARSIAPQPKLLMLDEPLGSLDRILREQLGDELRDVIKRLGLTALYVTHDQTEAFSVADQIVLLRDGQIEQQGTPRALYTHPSTRYAAQFMGLDNVIDAIVVRVEPDRVIVATPFGEAALAAQDRSWVARQHVVVVVRPEAGLSANNESRVLVAEGRVTKRAFRGAHERITLLMANGLALALDVNHMPSSDNMRVELDPAAMTILANSQAKS